jgi:precorrin-2 dehydrogenase / sirohydrochlorin ferrochelatase
MAWRADPEAPRYPVNLLLSGRPCLVVGGGTVARQKAAGLVECGALVHVVAPDVVPEIEAMGGVTVERRPYRRGEVAAYRLAIAATDDPAVNAAVYDDGEQAGVWVNSADDPVNCAFTLPARVRQGPLLATFSTGGHSPALAVWLRRRFQSELGPEYLTLLELLDEARSAIRGAGGTSEGLDWQKALDSGMLELIREGRITQAKERLQACLSSSSD